MNIILVSAATPDTFWSYKYAVPFLSKKAAYPPLGLLTVAAMLPREWTLQLVDLNVRRLKDRELDWADYVFLSAMVVQQSSVKEIVARCNARGRPLIAGGPLFTTAHEQFPGIHHFVLGEAENIMPTLIADLTAGNLKGIYQDSAKPDLANTPIPRWDLISLKDYVTMPVQFSRGCPFNCEFCDIIVMYGRIPRLKSPRQMIRELDALIDAGWKGPIFIVDDNFIANSEKVKVLLRELIAWRRRRRVRSSFITEASINLVDIPELLELMAQAGFKKVFLGIETTEEESLVECAKFQNIRRDMLAAVRRIQNAGIEAMGGFIVGFDNDKPTIFEQQRRFIQKSGIATAMVVLLTALPKTRLFSRLQREGRILHENPADDVESALNFVPKLDRNTLIEGYRSLVRNLYSPKNFYRRAQAFLREYQPKGFRQRITKSDLLAFVRSCWVLGVRNRGRSEYWKFLTRASLFHRRSFAEAVSLAIMGYHFRQIAMKL